MTEGQNDERTTPNWWASTTARMADVAARLRVGIYGSGGAPYHHAALLALWGFTPVPVRAEDIHLGALEHLDVLVFPGGGMKAMAGMLTPLGTGGATAVREWVQGGGTYIGSCAGSFLPAHVGEAYWSAHEEARCLHMIDARLANDSSSALEGLTSPGVGTLRATVTNAGHWLARDVPGELEIVHYNGPLFLPNAGGQSRRNALEAVDGVLRPVAATTAFTRSEHFLPSSAGVTPPHVLERCIDDGAFNAIAARYGRGTVVLFGSHPEFGFDALQLGWNESTVLLANALEHHADMAGGPNERRRAPEASAPPPGLPDALAEARAALERIEGHFRYLHDADAGPWLQEGYAASFLGRTPAALWTEVTRAGERTAREAGCLLEHLLSEPHDLSAASQWISDEPYRNQDVGFMGLRDLTALAERTLLVAKARLREAPAPLQHAYDQLERHPYQLAVGSYLSAAGLTSAALLSGTTIACLTGHRDAVPIGRLLRTEPTTIPASLAATT